MPYNARSRFVWGIRNKSVFFFSFFSFFSAGIGWMATLLEHRTRTGISWQENSRISSDNTLSSSLLNYSKGNPYFSLSYTLQQPFCKRKKNILSVFILSFYLRLRFSLKIWCSSSFLLLCVENIVAWSLSRCEKWNFLAVLGKFWVSKQIVPVWYRLPPPTAPGVLSSWN